MLLAIEILLLVWLLLTLVRLLRWGPAGMALDFACFLVACALGWTACQSGRLIGLLTDNLALRVLIILGGGLVGFLVPRCLLSRWLRREDRAVVRRFDARLGLGPWSRGILAGVGGVSYLAVMGFVCLVLVNVLAAVHPDLRCQFQERSLLLGRLLLPKTPAPGSDARRELDERISLQRRFFEGASRCFAEGVGLVADRSGTTLLVARLRALRALVSLETDLLAILAVEDPILFELLSHPALQNILEDEAVLTDLHEAGRGSLLAVYRLGEDARIKQLLNDAAFDAALRSFDLQATHLRADQLAACIRIAEPAWQWEDGSRLAPWRHQLLAWPSAGGRLSTTDRCVAGTMRVVIRSVVEHAVTVDGRVVPALRSGELAVYGTTVACGGHDLTVVAASGNESDRSAAIALFLPDAGW